MQPKQKIEKEFSPSSSPIERILYTTDLAPAADRALGYAILLARTFDSKLFLFHCLDETTPNFEASGYAHIEEIFKESLGAYLNPSDLPPLEWESLVAKGIPSKAIVKEATEQQANLIVIRSRRRPLAATLLGSTAESICRSAPCSILITHPNEREWVDGSTGKIEIRRILVAHDFSDFSKLALSYAVKFAKAFESELHLLHILPIGADASWSPLFGNPFHQAVSRLILAVPDDLRSSQTVIEGDPYTEILAYAKENDIDLICMGAHSKIPDDSSVFGTTVDRVVRQATCPIFIARTAASK